MQPIVIPSNPNRPINSRTTTIDYVSTLIFERAVQPASIIQLSHDAVEAGSAPQSGE
jgi:hypothetical protein